MANIKIKLTTFFVPEHGEAVYSQQTQGLELTRVPDHQLLSKIQA